MAKLKELLSRSRLVTLTGTAGVGKTRLALRVGALVHEGYADGVWLVELAALRDGALVGHTVTQALRITDRGDPLEVLGEYLRDRRILLVLDNCEHLVEDCAVLVAGLLSRTEELRVLATSRELLRVDSEHVWRVPPLPVSGRNAAAALFTERAVAVEPAFVGDEQRVTAICQRLDGLPLAIELAAAGRGCSHWTRSWCGWTTCRGC